MSSLDFLLDARLPPLDDYLSGSSQSVLFEVLFWTLLYVIYSNFASRLIRILLSQLPFWRGEIRQRGGIFCANAQDDVVLMLLLGIHHGTAGYMCLQGVQNGDGNMWRHGYLLETGFEVADLLAMALSMYPYRLDNIKPELKPAMIFHHLPGVMFCGVILGAGLNNNNHIQEIAFWFLAGAAFSCVAAAAVYTMSLETQMVSATVCTLANSAFFIFCRSLQAAGTFFFLFNLAILGDLIPKCIRYTKRCLDGVTPIETEEIPLSREDRAKGRRRSSVMMAIAMVNATTKKRRSSMATLMGLNNIEVVHHAQEEQKIRKSMDEKDFAAIHQTMKKINSGGKKD